MKTLPPLPNAQYLLREAKRLKSCHRKGDSSICETIGHFDTSLHGMTNEEIFDTHFSILDAQRVVSRQYGFSSWSRLRLFVDRQSAGNTPSDKSLNAKLIDRYEELVSLQDDIKNKNGDYKKKYERYRALAQEYTRMLNCAYDVHGWPGPDVVGAECVFAVYFVAANAVYDAQFQRRTVQLMGESLPQGGYFANSYSQSLDRNLTLSKQPTVYGNSFGSYYNDDGDCELLTSEVQDPDNLDKRRARVGLTSLNTEIMRCVREAKEDNWVLPTREQSLEQLNQLSEAGGYL